MTTSATPPTPPRPQAVRSSLPALFFTDELKREYPSIFVYAIAGTGKTNVFRSVSGLKPLVLATEDGNTKGMGTLGDMHIACLLLNRLQELEAVTAELIAKSKPGELHYAGHGPFGLLGLDSATGVGMFLEEGAKALKGWDMIWDSGPGRGKDPRSAYPYIAEKGRQVIRKLMSLPVPLVITCREQIVTEGEGDAAISYAAPELPGQKLPRELPGWPEATLRMRIVNTKRVFITENEGNVIARIRLREGLRCPKYIKPDLGLVLRLLQGDESALPLLSIDTSVPKTPQQLAAEARQGGTAATPAVQTQTQPQQEKK